MYKNIKIWLELPDDKRAVTALEYGLIAGVIATVLIVGFTAYGTNLARVFTTLAV